MIHLRVYNRPRSIYQYSNMAPRLSGKNCTFFKFLLSLNSQKRLGYKESNTKYRRFRLAKIVCTVFNVINSEQAPKSIKDLIGFRNNKYNLRGSKILKRPKASTTTYGLKSWRFMAPKLWNSLPDSSRTVRTVKAFKNSIKILDLTGLL